ncbi:hypothetical protein BT67DRAFT_434131 [Trichocladium antarcticum]|uniref:Sulphur transport domain-containing protein n=1 Tax=Trichocladium antarcticum TaxID=1450529 RepID=A0AAN6UL59_9PEZI|nr:hypothetical protein BT67DRAFT_434131 [Trichocladium antarcticum]
MNNILTGAAMGAALTVTGVYEPSVILAQFNFSDFSMLQTFLTAAAGSTILVTLSQTLHLTSLAPRPPASLGLLSRFDGNMLGGALLGAGMAISGACPGTVLAQLGAGVRSGRWAFAGAVLAGAAWSVFGAGACRRVPKKDAEEKGPEAADKKKATTVYEMLGISRGAAVVGFEAAVAVVLVLAAKYATAMTAARGISPLVGGLAIAAAQLVSIVLRRSLLGASTSFEELGGGIWRLLKGQGVAAYGNILFSAGVVAGAWLLSTTVPSLAPVSEVIISPIRSVLGGFMIVLGSRMAGGCTSGHGISGLSLMSMSSFLTVMSVFSVGGLTSLLMG